MDTNFISALFYKDDINHKTAIRRIKDIPQESILIVPSIVLIELSMANIPEINTRDLLYFAKQLGNKIVEFNSVEVDEYLSFKESLKEKCKTIDAMVLYHAINLGAELLTYDKRLQKISYLIGLDQRF